MNVILISILPVVGVCVGAILQHFLAKAKETTARFEVRQHEAYADYLRGVAAVAIFKADESRALVADAKSRIAHYGSVNILDRV